MSKILLVEDDKNLSDSLCQYLEREGFQIIRSDTLATAREKLALTPSLVVLDWMLPDGQGIDFLREMRKKEILTPVILLTSRTDLVDKILGLETGANDYITKPFEPRELVARIRSHLRTVDSFTQSSKAPEKIEVSGISLNRESMEVTYKNKLIALTKMEFHLLRTFIENPERVFPREALLNEVWGYDNFPTTRTIDNHVLQLRQKFESSMFETVRGVGYRFRKT